MSNSVYAVSDGRGDTFCYIQAATPAAAIKAATKPFKAKRITPIQAEEAKRHGFTIVDTRGRIVRKESSR